MSFKIKTINALSTFEKAALLIEENDIKHLLVVFNNKLVGIV